MATSIAGYQGEPAAITFLSDVVSRSFLVSVASAPADAGEVNTPVAYRLRLHGIDAPELDQTFWWRGEQIACGTMSLAALEALIAGVRVRCDVVERDRHGGLAASAPLLEAAE